MRKLIGFILLINLTFNWGCTSDDQVYELNIQEIKQYILENNLDAQETNSGLHYVIVREGDGTFPTSTSQVTVLYEGKYIDGTVFDTTYDDNETITFGLNAVIEGWQEGIPLISKGGEGILLIPASLGYGSTPPSGIRSNAVLIFRVELIDF